MSWVYLLLLNMRCNWVAATPRINSCITTKTGAQSSCQNLPEICSRHGLQRRIYTQSLEVWPKVQKKSNYWCDYCWGTSSWVRSVYIRGRCISSLSLLCNYIMTFLYWVGAAFTGCLTMLTHRGQKPDKKHESTKCSSVTRHGAPGFQYYVVI